ncbi:hypothetical protein N825_21885 [Skermanella stibiiresistens SB22]|uniref:Polysaccharide biosynthesis protein C-terminal domain-containing protein n=1 Tax=Skermanella stibiiresistens SB22 TaxID=1385369 RepID=W9GT73_9PROT|nr:hypothetical protein N825_21885 [Skermanella stibiiresistens SB22]
MTIGSFISGVLVAQALGVEGIGAVAYIIWLVQITAPIIDLGAASTITRFVPELTGQGNARQADLLSRFIYRILLASVAVTGCLFALIFHNELLSKLIWEPLVERGSGTGDSSHLWILIIAFVSTQTLGAYTNGYFRGSQAFGLLARLAALSFICQIAAVVAGAWLFGIEGALAGYMIGQVIPALASLRFLGGASGLDRALLRRAGRYSAYAWAANVANAFVWSRIEIFFLGNSWGNEAVGIFSVALALTSLAFQGPMMLTTGILPMLSEHRGREDLTMMKLACGTGTRLLALLVMPSCLGMAAVMPVILPMIYGADFAPAVPAAIVLVCAAAISATTVVGTNFVLAMERNDFVFFSSLFGAVIVTLAGMFMIPVFGVMGAAVVRASIQIILVICGAWFIVVRLRCPLPFAALGRIALAAMLCAAAAAGCVAVIPSPVSLIVAIPVGMVSYLLALRWLRAVPESDIQMLSGLVDMTPAFVRLPTGNLLKLISG